MLKKPQVIKEVQFLTRTYKVDMIFLLETMVNEKNLLNILPQIGFDLYDYVIPQNHSGAITVLWNNGNIHASTLLKEQRAIHMLIHDPQKGQNSVVSRIYVPVQTKEKDQFWEHLVQLNRIFDVPWCLMGDFNELASPNEKGGDKLLPTANFKDLTIF